MFMPHEKQSWNELKQLLFRTHLSDEWKLIYARWYQEIWVNIWRFVSLFENILQLFSLLVASDQNL